MNNQEIAKELNDILTRNYDAEKGYKEAAENVDNAHLKNLFNEQAQNRYDFGHKIKEKIRSLGEEPNKGTSLAGDIHRGWMNLRDFFTSGDDAILAECIRGEKAAIEEYDELLNNDDIPTSIKLIFTDQKASIVDALRRIDRIKEMSN